ncbi:hypothetical protein LSAT2_001870 [Lamellibrachia satsuma]|nr:hypothetical protein LSAT2_001870 [Lamellibrachia satsuma]
MAFISLELKVCFLLIASIAVVTTDEVMTYKRCLAQCEDMFLMCLRMKCPVRDVKKPPPQLCIDIRDDCIHHCKLYKNRRR